MKRVFQLTTVFALLITVMSSCGGDADKLRMNLSDGAEYSTEMSMKMTMTSPAFGEMGSTENLMTFYLNQSVADNGDETYTVKNVFNKFDMNFAGQELSFDAETAASNDTIPAEVSDMFKSSFSYTVNNLGKMVGEVDYSDFPAAMEQSMNLDQVSGSAFEFPEEAISVGYSWKNLQEMNQSGIEISADMTYTVKEITSTSVVVEGEGPLSGEGTVQGIGASVKGDLDGTYTLDKTTGWLLEADYTMGMDMQMTMPGQAEAMEMNTVTEMLITSEQK